MSKLFIIGNGFDKAHKMPTEYADFRKYLIQKYNAKEDYCRAVPAGILDGRGADRFDEEEVADFWFNVFDGNADINWSDFEESLHGLDYGDCFSEAVCDKEGDEDFFKTTNNNEDTANDIMKAIPFIESFFTDWIQGVQVSTALLPQFNNLINPLKDYFFSFNYTATLERLYNVENVCHIHGRIGDELIFGHGNNENKYDSYQQNKIGTESVFADIDKMLRKKVKEAIKRHYKFFDELEKSNIESIYSYGFSFGNVDLPYIERIISLVPPNTKWYFDKYTKKAGTYDTYKQIIRRNGFCGKVTLF